MKRKFRLEDGSYVSASSWFKSLAWRLVLALVALVVLARSQSTVSSIIAVGILALFFLRLGTFLRAALLQDTRITLVPGEFDVILKSPGGRSADVRVALHELLDLDSSEAAAMTDRAPVSVCTQVSQQNAQQLADRLTSVGATISVRPPLKSDKRV